MKTKFVFYLFSFSILLNFNASLYSCTTFCLQTENELIFGRNYDWTIEYGIIFVNKKDVLKTAANEFNKQAQWTSKYGSVTFNQFGREFPTGGINETGLVIELMWLEGTEYPEKDHRPAVGGILQWIQYQLDNCSTVEEVIETDKHIRIPKGAVPVHYLVTDSSGNSASIEFLKGRLKVYSGNEMKFSVLTNDTYEYSIDYINELKIFGGRKNLTNENNSLFRFAKTCSMIQNYKDKITIPVVDYGFEILNEVSQNEYTRWSIVYDIKNRKIFYKTNSNKEIRNIDMSMLDFKCITPVMMIDINEGRSENINYRLKDYSYESNRKLIEDSYGSVDFLKDTSDEEKNYTASYPEKLHCTGGSGFNENENPETKAGIPALIFCGVFIGAAAIFLKYKLL